MKQAEFVAFVQNVIMNFVVDIFAKPSLMSKKYTQTHFVHMLNNTPDSSNSEVIIMFPGQNFIQIVIHGDNVR